MIEVGHLRKAYQPVKKGDWLRAHGRLRHRGAPLARCLYPFSTGACGDILAVDRIDFTVEPGEALGLSGPNGAGRTTTIHMLVGALRPNAASFILGITTLARMRD